MNFDSNESTLVDIDQYKVGKSIGHQSDIKDKFLLNECRREIRSCNEEIRELKQAIKIVDLEKLEKLEKLVKKWRLVSERTLSYLHYSTLQKIDRMGGYEKFQEMELDQRKKEVEDEVYRYEEEMESFLQSNEFQMLNENDQIEYNNQVEAKTEELEKIKEKKLEQIEEEFEAKDSTFTLKELAKLLKVDYNLIFPE